MLSRYKTTMAEAIKKVYEDGHIDVPSAKRKMKLMIEDANQIMGKLNSMNNEDKLPSWWMDMINTASDNMNSARDYFLTSEKHSKQTKGELEIDEASIKPYVSMMRDNGKMKYRVLDKDEKEILVTTDGKKAEDFFKKNYNKLRAGSIKPMKEETDLEEFTSSQIARLKKEYESLRGKETGINPEKFKRLRGMMRRFPKASLLKLAKADIPILTTGAKASLVINHGMKWKQLPEELVPYISFEDNLQEKFVSVDDKVLDRIKKMMKGPRQERESLANLMNYFMPPEVVDMVRDKFNIRSPRGRIKISDFK